MLIDDELPMALVNTTTGKNSPLPPKISKTGK